MKDLMMILHWFNSSSISGVIFDLCQHEHTLTEARWEGGPSCEFYIADGIIRKILVLDLFSRITQTFLTSLNLE